MDGDPVGPLGCLPDAGADLANGFPPDRVVEGGKVQVGIGGMHADPERERADDIIDLRDVFGVVEPVGSIGHDLPALVSGRCDALYPPDVIPYFG